MANWRSRTSEFRRPCHSGSERQRLAQFGTSTTTGTRRSNVSKPAACKLPLLTWSHSIGIDYPGTPWPLLPWFFSGSAEHRISINVYPWRDLAFWSTSLSHPDRKRKEISVPLRVVRRTAERVTLWIPHRMEECWAPTSAVTDVDPFDLEEYLGHLQQRREHKLMQWSMLPGWLQFAILGRTQSLFGRGSDPSEWEARTVLTSSNDPYAVFNACLELLDSHGFDSTGGIRPGHSYFLQVWQQGQILQSCIHSDSEGEAIVALLNAGEVSISLRYSKSGCILAA